MKLNVAYIMSNKIKSIPRSIRFEKDDWQALSKLANKYDLSMSHLVRKAVKNYIKNSY